MSDLILAVKSEYFDLILEGLKDKEFRKIKPYWTKRLVNKSYDNVVITKGYPKKDDYTRILTFPYNGYVIEPIKHKEFNNQLEDVYAILLLNRKV
jgi:hypothetical protein